MDQLDQSPKKRKNSRSKGKRGENAVAKMCAAWWAQLEPGVEFRSTPSSGGWATPQLRGHFKIAGDLTTTAKHWPFTVEVKRREGWTLARLYAAKPSPVWKWWKQACESAVEEGRAPLLIFRHNNDEWLVLLPAALDELIPRLDNWGLRMPRPTCEVPPMLTTWDVLRGSSPAAIIKVCPAPASPPALGASQARPKAKSSKPPPLPSKARQRPAQAGASLPPVLEEEEAWAEDRRERPSLSHQLQTIGEHLATPPPINHASPPTKRSGSKAASRR